MLIVKGLNCFNVKERERGKGRKMTMGWASKRDRKGIKEKGGNEIKKI
jgi:hypothetical protein